MCRRASGGRHPRGGPNRPPPGRRNRIPGPARRDRRRPRPRRPAGARHARPGPRHAQWHRRPRHVHVQADALAEVFAQHGLQAHAAFAFGQRLHGHAQHDGVALHADPFALARQFGRQAGDRQARPARARKPASCRRCGRGTGACAWAALLGGPARPMTRAGQRFEFVIRIGREAAVRHEAAFGFVGNFLIDPGRRAIGFILRRRGRRDGGGRRRHGQRGGAGLGLYGGRRGIGQLFPRRHAFRRDSGAAEGSAGLAGAA